MNVYSIINILIVVSILNLSVEAYSSEIDTDENNNIPVVVMLASLSQHKQFLKVTQSMTAQFEDSGIDFKIKWLDELPLSLPEQENIAALVYKKSEAVAVLWCDIITSDKLYFYITTAGDGKVLARKVSNTDKEALGDTLAIISRLSVDAILDGGVIDIAPLKKQVAAPSLKKEAKHDNFPEIPNQTKKNRANPKISARLGSAYTISILSPDGSVINGLELRFSIELLKRITLLGGYTFYGSITDSKTSAQLTLQRHPAYAGLEFFSSKKRWRFGGQLNLIVDYTKRIPEKLSTSASVESPYGKVGISIESSFTARVNLYRTIWLFSRLGGEIFFYNPDWILESNTKDETFFNSMWIVQPKFVLGLEFTIF